jgi:hypothetical protein
MEKYFKLNLLILWLICWKPKHFIRSRHSKYYVSVAIVIHVTIEELSASVFSLRSAPAAAWLQYRSYKKICFPMSLSGGYITGTKGTSTIFSWVPRDSDPRITALARRNSNCKRQTRPLDREGAPHLEVRNCLTVTKIRPWDPDGVSHQDRVADWQSIVI